MADDALPVPAPAHPNLKPPWAKGQSGNPSGRPVGARHRLSEAFVTALAEDFGVHGKDAIKKARKKDPVRYLDVIARMVPKDLFINSGSVDYPDLSDEELEEYKRELLRLFAEHMGFELVEATAEEVGS